MKHLNTSVDALLSISLVQGPIKTERILSVCLSDNVHQSGLSFVSCREADCWEFESSQDVVAYPKETPSERMVFLLGTAVLLRKTGCLRVMQTMK